MRNPSSTDEQPPGRGPQSTAANFALLAAIAIGLFMPVFLHPNRMFWASDIVRAHIEYKEIQWRSFWEWGHFPLWDPTVFCGKSIVGDPLPALLNPFAAVFWFIPAPSLFGYFLWWMVLIGAWGMFLYARQKSCDATGALVAAIAFAFGGKTAAHVFAGHVELLSTMLVLPWIMWALERVLKNPGPATATILGVAITIAAFGGSVQILYWHLLFLSGYTLLWCLSHYEEYGVKSIGRSVLGACSGLILFATLAAPWWIPIVRQTLLLGARAQTADFAFAAQNSASFSDLLRFVWPNLGVPAPQVLAPDPVHKFFWETSSYPGILTIALAVAAFASIRHIRGITTLAFLALLAIIVALGENSPFFWLAYKLVPGFSFFRCPGRLFFYSNFALAVLAGLMVTHGASVKHKWLVPAVFGILFEAILIGGLIVYRSQGPTKGFWWPLIFTLAATILSFLWVSGMFRDSWWRLALVMILTADLLLVWRPVVNVIDPRQVLPRLAVAEFLADKQKEEPFRIYDPTQSIEQHIAAKYGLELITGYHPGIYQRHLQLYKKIWKTDGSSVTEQYMHGPTEIACPNILDLMNVKYLIAFEPDLGPDYERVMETPPGEFMHPRYLYQRRTALPRAWLVSAAETPRSGSTVLDELCSFDPHTICLVENAPIDGGASFAELKATRTAPADLAVKVSTDKPGIVVFSEVWHPDWRATDNGNSTSARRVNYNFLGIPVPAGEHEIHLWYRPWDFYLGLAIAIPAWLLIAYLGAHSYYHFRRQKANS